MSFPVATRHPRGIDLEINHRRSR